MKTKLSKEDLKNHWWYRLLKVVHILVIIFLLMIVGVGAWTEKPTLNEYSSTYQIKCNVDGVLRGDIKGSDLYHYEKLSFVSDSGTEISRFVCLDSSKTLDKEQFKIAYVKARDNGTIPNSDNFEILLKNPSYDGSWGILSLVLILGIVVVFLLSWIAQSIFLYVLIGQKPQILFRKQNRVFPVDESTKN